MQLGNVGDVKPLPAAVQESRIEGGPGYRVYSRRQVPIVVLLLSDSYKGGQAVAIRQAAYLNDWGKQGRP